MKRTLLLGGSLTLKAALNFAALIVYARVLSPAEYGIYAFVLGLVLMADMFGFAWLRFSYTRFYVQAKQADNRILAHLMLMFLVLAMAMWGLAGGVAWLNPSGYISPALWLCVAGLVVGEAVFNTQLSYANNNRKEGHFLALSAVKSLSSLAIGWALVMQGYGVMGAVVGQLVAYALVALPLLGYGKALLRLNIGRIHPETLRMLMAFGLPLAVMGGLEHTLAMGQRTLVLNMLGPDALGVFAVVNDVVQKVLVFLMLTLNVSMLPVVVDLLDRKGKEEARKQLARNALVLAGLALPAGVGMAMLAPQVCAVLMGEAFRAEAAPLLPWFVVAALVKGAVSFYLMHAFYLAKTNRKLIVPFLVLVGLGLVGSWVGLRVGGLMGIQAAMMATWAVYALWVAIRGRVEFEMPLPWGGLLRIAVATLAMAGAVVWVWHLEGFVGLMVGAGVGGMVYGASLLAMNVLGLRDMVWIKINRRIG